MLTQKRNTLAAKCDRLWGELIHLRGRCEVCGSTWDLQAHHIITRANKSTRWQEWNGILLCREHHTDSSVLSAHRTPKLFEAVLAKLKPDVWAKVRSCRHEIRKVNFHDTFDYLVDVLENTRRGMAEAKQLQGGEG